MKTSLGSLDLGENTTTVIYNELDNDGIDEFRFRLLDTNGTVILSSSRRYPTEQFAFSALQTAVDHYLNTTNSINIKTSTNGKWYFNVVNEQQAIVARRIEYFDTQALCEAEVERVKTILETN
jgi:uncharacterized protein YegP (UPF0339 family)